MLTFGPDLRTVRANLLVVDWARGHGWEALCGFLDLSIPEVPFPHLNRRPSG
jgi:hypothetical protein